MAFTWYNGKTFTTILRNMETRSNIDLVFELRERHTYSAVSISKFFFSIITTHDVMAFTSYNIYLFSELCITVRHTKVLILISEYLNAMLTALSQFQVFET